MCSIQIFQKKINNFYLIQNQTDLVQGGSDRKKIYLQDGIAQQTHCLPFKPQKKNEISRSAAFFMDSP